jgi:hypothetical protein
MSWFRLRPRTILIAVPIAAAVSYFLAWSRDFDAAMARTSSTGRGRPAAWDSRSPIQLASRALHEGRYQDAETWYRTSLEGSDRRFTVAHDPEGRLNAQLGYARALEGQGRIVEAEHFLERAVAEGSSKLPESDRLLILSRRRLDILREKSKPEEHARENSRAPSPAP